MVQIDVMNLLMEMKVRIVAILIKMEMVENGGQRCD